MYILYLNNNTYYYYYYYIIITYYCFAGVMNEKCVKIIKCRYKLFSIVLYCMYYYYFTINRSILSLCRNQLFQPCLDS